MRFNPLPQMTAVAVVHILINKKKYSTNDWCKSRLRRRRCLVVVPNVQFISVYAVEKCASVKTNHLFVFEKCTTLKLLILRRISFEAHVANSIRKVRLQQEDIMFDNSFTSALTDNAMGQSKMIEISDFVKSDLVTNKNNVLDCLHNKTNTDSTMKSHKC
ncbi:hypothetical protein M0802_012012 [Mischocyttarus mexicanus]|nr:hypothetical protein M0802_012012 [Mischocyttarus mexicanus]